MLNIWWSSHGWNEWYYALTLALALVKEYFHFQSTNNLRIAASLVSHSLSKFQEKISRENTFHVTGKQKPLSQGEKYIGKLKMQQYFLSQISALQKLSILFLRVLFTLIGMFTYTIIYFGTIFPICWGFARISQTPNWIRKRTEVP